MKKIKLIIAAVAMMGLFSSSAAYADGFAPGEGLYLGAFVGAGSGIVQPKVTSNGDGGVAGTTTRNQRRNGSEGGTFEATEGGLGLAGLEAGGWLGYGYKMGDFYAGLEGEMAGGDVEFKLTSAAGVEVSIANRTVTEVSAKKEWTGGMFGRLGVYLNPTSLLSFRGGVLVSKFEVNYGANSEDFYGGGPSFGVSLESTIAAIDPNLSLRMDTVYTDFMTASVFSIGDQSSQADSSIGGRAGHNSEITGSALSARVGLTYSFFDVNTLF